MDSSHRGKRSSCHTANAMLIYDGHFCTGCTVRGLCHLKTDPIIRQVVFTRGSSINSLLA
jgi:hypothetical protein